MIRRLTPDGVSRRVFFCLIPIMAPAQAPRGLNPLNEQQARIAWELNHIGAFQSDQPEYRDQVNEAYLLAAKAAERDPSCRERAFNMADKYAQKLAEWYNKGYRIGSMCPSVLVSGSANFPTRKKVKQNRARDNHYKELAKVENLKSIIRKMGTTSEVIKCGDGDAIERLTAKVEALTKKQQEMKAANARARKEGKAAPFPPFKLSNNNQNIRAIKKRLASLESAKEKGTQKQRIAFMGEDVEVTENTELMRLQLRFDGKPSEQVRAALKKHGFRWSPKNEAWQRQLTDNACCAPERLMKEVV